MTTEELKSGYSFMLDNLKKVAGTDQEALMVEVYYYQPQNVFHLMHKGNIITAPDLLTLTKMIDALILVAGFEFSLVTVRGKSMENYVSDLYGKPGRGVVSGGPVKSDIGRLIKITQPGHGYDNHVGQILHIFPDGSMSVSTNNKALNVLVKPTDKYRYLS